jgi:translation initiation factor IF-3
MLEKVISDVKDYATVDFPPKMEGKQLIIILSPAK